MWAMSVLGSAKSNRHRKTHRVEPDGAGRKFMHLTRGGLPRESAGEVSRGHSSEEAPRKRGRAKGQRTNRRKSTSPRQDRGRGVIRNDMGSGNCGSCPDRWRGKEGVDSPKKPIRELQALGMQEGGERRCLKNNHFRGGSRRRESDRCWVQPPDADPHVRWCGRVTGRNPRDPIRSKRTRWPAGEIVDVRPGLLTRPSARSPTCHRRPGVRRPAPRIWTLFIRYFDYTDYI